MMQSRSPYASMIVESVENLVSPGFLMEVVTHLNFAVNTRAHRNAHHAHERYTASARLRFSVDESITRLHELRHQQAGP